MKLTTVSKGGADMGTVVPADALSKAEGKVLAGKKGLGKNTMLFIQGSSVITYLGGDQASSKCCWYF